MSRYEVDPTEPDCLGLVARQDGVGRGLSDLNETECAGYVKLLKKHLYSHHGLNTSLWDVHPVNAGELEAVHYMVHELGYYTKPHTHGVTRLPDLGTLINLPPDEAARLLILKIRAKTEARRNGGE